MYQSRLVKYILQLTPKEKETFHQFVISPYFNQHKKTIALLKIIQAGEDNPKKKLEKHKVFKKLFPGLAFEEQKLHNTMSYLMKLYHRFLAYQYFEEQDFQEQLYTLEAAYFNNQFDLFKNRANQLQKLLNKHPVQNSHIHHIRYRLNYLLGGYETGYVNRSNTAYFQQMSDYLDEYYISEKLKHTCTLVGHMIVMNTQYNFGFLDDLLNYIQSNWETYENKPSITPFYTILMMFREEEHEVYYNQLKTKLEMVVQRLSEAEVHEIYDFAFNYCIQQIGRGENRYQRELFSLYQQGIENGALLDNGILSEWNYKNITTLGSALKEFEWTKNFLEKYKEKLPEQTRENAYNFNLARFYYSQKLYDDTFSLLLHVQFTEVQYHTGATEILIRSYYELEDYEALLSLLETFRIYVIRNRKMTTVKKKGYTNYCRFAKKLVLLKNSRFIHSKQAYQEKIKTLLKKIQETPNVLSKQWLVQECQEEVT